MQDHPLCESPLLKLVCTNVTFCVSSGLKYLQTMKLMWRARRRSAPCTRSVTYMVQLWWGPCMTTSPPNLHTVCSYYTLHSAKGFLNWGSTGGHQGFCPPLHPLVASINPDQWCLYGGYIPHWVMPTRGVTPSARLPLSVNRAGNGTFLYTEGEAAAQKRGWKLSVNSM